jgi:putative ABC transport system substrate-binding protein
MPVTCFYDDRVLLASIAMRYRLPTLAAEKEILEAGALVSYVPNLAELDQRHAAFIDRILRGAKPADLPIEQPTKFDLVIKLKSARALGIVVPQTLLRRAAEVIQ